MKSCMQDKARKMQNQDGSKWTIDNNVILKKPSNKLSHRERVTFYCKHRIKLMIDDKISRVINWYRCLQGPWKKLNVACLRHYEIVYHHGNHFSLSYKNKMAFFYLTIFLLCLYRRVVCSLQKVSYVFRCSDTRVPFFFIFLISTSCF